MPPPLPERLPPDGVSTTLVAVKQLRNTPRPHTPRTNREVVGGAGPKVAHALGEHVAEVHHVVARGRRGPSHGDHVGEEGVGLNGKADEVVGAAGRVQGAAHVVDLLVLEGLCRREAGQKLVLPQVVAGRDRHSALVGAGAIGDDDDVHVGGPVSKLLVIGVASSVAVDGVHHLEPRGVEHLADLVGPQARGRVVRAVEGGDGGRREVRDGQPLGLG
mmetsp:Transcript_15904/g.43034  ORF Transcript_15904/g.43034 Transcript_15904/m.43034 type:complete len:217 (+) Transcript_15904:343-993(+)